MTQTRSTPASLRKYAAAQPVAPPPMMATSWLEGGTQRSLRVLDVLLGQLHRQVRITRHARLEQVLVFRLWIAAADGMRDVLAKMDAHAAHQVLDHAHQARAPTRAI